MKRSENFNDVQQNKRQKLDSGAGTSSKPSNEWDDDDLNGDLLEEVCIIAELTQAASTKTFKAPAPPPGQDAESYITAENKRLREALKTKEGEVGILRSQLKTQQTARDNDVINSRRAVDAIEEKNKTSLQFFKKSVESLQNELDFKNLEVKGLIEKCKQLEVKSSKVHFVQPVTDDRKSLFSLSQAISTNKPKPSRSVEAPETSITPEVETIETHEGDELRKLIPPSFCPLRNEPSVIPLYPCSTAYKDILDIAKSDKYKWIGLPKPTPRFHLIQPLVLELTKSKTFPVKILKEIVEVSVDVLKDFVCLLEFLNKLPLNSEQEKKLLSEVDVGRNWRLQDLLSDKLFSENEKGLELRRVLGVVSCIGRSSSSSVSVLSSSDLLSLSLDVVLMIGKLQRPSEFSGVFIGILFFVQTLLKRRDADIPTKLTETSRKIISEMIKCRPKLDVLSEVMLTLGIAAHCKDLTTNICGRSSPESCALYMDAKLQQATFFTKDACPLNVLRIRTKTLAHFCHSKEALQRLIDSFSKWLHGVLENVPPRPAWLFPHEETTCCNVLECFCHVLSLSVGFAEEDVIFRRVYECGLITLRDCCKICRRRPRLYTINLLPHTLRQSKLIELLTKSGREAAKYFISEFEGDNVTQDSIT